MCQVDGPSAREGRGEGEGGGWRVEGCTWVNFCAGCVPLASRKPYPKNKTRIAVTVPRDFGDIFCQQGHLENNLGLTVSQWLSVETGNGEIMGSTPVGRILKLFSFMAIVCVTNSA